MTTYAEQAKILDLIAILGDCTAHDVVNRDHTIIEDPFQMQKLMNRLCKSGHLKFVGYVDSPIANVKRVVYRRTDRPAPEAKYPPTATQAETIAKRTAAMRAAKDAKESYRPSVEGARVFRLENTRHNAHDGIRNRGGVGGQSTLARIY